MSLDRLKVAIFMKLWEYFNRVDTIRELEHDIESKLYQPRRFPKELLDGVVKDFFSIKGVAVNVVENEEGSFLFHKEIENRKDNIFIEFISRHVGDIRESLNRVPKKENLFYLDDSQTENLMEYIKEDYDDKKSKLEFIKSYLRNTLDLDDKDAIFLVNSKIFIRYYGKQESEGSEKRYSGIPADDMEKFLQNFKDIDCGKIVSDIGKNMVRKYLNPQEVDNIFFQKNLIPYFQKGILAVFKKYIDCEELYMPFTNYVLRNNINTGLIAISDYILELATTESENIKKFISFYDGTTVIQSGKRITKSVIIVGDDIFSYPSINNIVSLKNKKQLQLLDKEKEVKKAKASLDKNTLKLKNYQKDKEYIEKVYEEKNNECNEIHDKLKKLRKEYQELQVKNKTNSKDPMLLTKIEEYKEAIAKLSKEEEEKIALREKSSNYFENVKIKIIETNENIESLNQKILNLVEQSTQIRSEFTIVNTRVQAVASGLAQAIIATKV